MKSKILLNDKCLYFHINPSTLKVFYVGIGNKQRAYYSGLEKRSKFWHNTVNKYGYIVDIIYENLTWEKACELEIMYIKHFGRKDLGEGSLVNLTNGGEQGLGRIITEEEKAKRKLRYSQRTEEEKRRSNEKRRQWSSSRKHSEVSKQKMSIQKKKYAIDNPITEMTKRKMSQAKLGNTNKKGKKVGKTWNKDLANIEYMVVLTATNELLFIAKGHKDFYKKVFEYNSNCEYGKKININKLKKEKQMRNFTLITKQLDETEGMFEAKENKEPTLEVVK